jgi:methylated-DNA-[protein]-cysteine S-methyltransferase
MDYDIMGTRFGELLIAGDAAGLRLLLFDCEREGRCARPDWHHRPVELAAVRGQLEEYFAGERRNFDVRLAPEGTEFQRRVWSELVKIPYGQTISYGELASRVGNPNAARAVGAANGRNPISIIIPCHRVVGSSGRLTGYGGGLPVKVGLLELERPIR